MIDQKTNNKGLNGVVGFILMVSITVIIVAAVVNFSLKLGLMLDDEPEIEYNRIDNNTVEVIWSEGGEEYDKLSIIDSKGNNRSEISSVGESATIKHFKSIGIIGDGYVYLDSYWNKISGTDRYGKDNTRKNGNSTEETNNQSGTNETYTINNIKYTIGNVTISFDEKHSQVKYLKLYSDELDSILIHDGETIDYRERLDGDSYGLYSVTYTNEKQFIEEFE